MRTFPRGRQLCHTGFWARVCNTQMMIHTMGPEQLPLSNMGDGPWDRRDVMRIVKDRVAEARENPPPLYHIPLVPPQ